MRIVYLLLLILWSVAGDITANVLGQSVFVEGNARSPSILLQSSVRSETMIASNVNAKSVESNELVTKKLSAKTSQIDFRGKVVLRGRGGKSTRNEKVKSLAQVNGVVTKTEISIEESSIERKDIYSAPHFEVTKSISLQRSDLSSAKARLHIKFSLGVKENNVRALKITIRDLQGRILGYSQFSSGSQHDIKIFIPDDVSDILLTVEGTLVGGASKAEVPPILKIEEIEVIQH